MARDDWVKSISRFPRRTGSHIPEVARRKFYSVTRTPNVFTSPLCHARRSAYFRVDRATTTVFNYRKSSRRVVNGVRNSSKYTCFLYALFVPSIAYLSFYIYIFIRTRTASFRIFILAPAPNSAPSPLFSHRRHLRPPTVPQFLVYHTRQRWSVLPSAATAAAAAPPSRPAEPASPRAAIRLAR